MAKARLCVTVAAPTTAALREARDRVANADLVELRLDMVADPDPVAAIADRRLPVIVTCRPRWEGGRFDGSEEERRRLLHRAQLAGAEYIDVEWKAGFSNIVESRRGRGVIVSHHDFAGVPVDLNDRVRAMHATGAEVVKIAIMARRLTDTLPLLSLPRRSGTTLIALAMGEAGLATRVLAARFGSAWTYAGPEIAPGQVDARTMESVFGYSRLTERSAIYGVVGQPVMHSLSPAMHNAAFRAAGLDASYLPLAAADFPDFVTFADACGVSGVSVTAPFKLAAFDAAAHRDAISQRVQSLNTLKRQSAGWAGLNTDVAGFLGPLKDTPLRGARATILGAGGASRAAAIALESVGARVAISARRAERARVAASLTGAAVAPWPPPHGSWDLLVNATPVGTAPDIADSPLPAGPFTGHLVYDLVYNPTDTRLLRDARAAGCRTIGGLAMLVGQAERQFTWWTGAPADARVMRDAALDALAGREPIPAQAAQTKVDPS
jgi:3-dehydroquinate dehydratase/shikimate dehydrogenase